MRVTKVIREYVEREIGAKFDPQLKEIGKEYAAERKILEDRLKELEKETEEKAVAIAAELGFSYSSWHSNAVRVSPGYFENEEKAKADHRLRAEIQDRRDKAIENILLNLELGETTKAELRDAIEAVSV